MLVASSVAALCQPKYNLHRQQRAQRTVVAVLGLAAALIVFQLSTAAAQTKIGIAARVNDVPITNFDVSQRVRFIALTQRKQPSAALRKKVLEQLINERLQMQEARRLNISIPKEQIMKAINQIALRNRPKQNPAWILAALSKAGVSPETWKDQLRAQMAWQKAAARKFSRSIFVSQKQIDKTLGTGGQSQANSTTELNLTRIALSYPTGADQRKIASRLRDADRIRAKFTTCKTVNAAVKGIGGVTVTPLGKKTATDLGEPARTIVLQAGRGQVAPPQIKRASVEMIAVCEKRSVKKADSKKRSAVRAKLATEELRRRAARLLRDLRQDAVVQIN